MMKRIRPLLLVASLILVLMLTLVLVPPATVYAQSLSVSPANGPPGTVLTITGSGFPVSIAGVVWFDSNGNSAWDAGEPQVSVTTTAAGALPAGVTLIVPLVAPAATYRLRADIPVGGAIEASSGTFTVSTPGITLTPPSGIVGTVITVTGTNFALNTAGVVWFDTNSNSAWDAGEPQVSVTTTAAAGALPTGVTLTVPSVGSGTYQVRADIPSGGTIEASSGFIVPVIGISLAPTSGAPGTVMTVSGSSFNPSAAGTVWFDTNGNNIMDAGEPQVSVTTTAAGALPTGVTLTVPILPSGTYWVRTDIPSGGAVEAATTFTVSTSISLSPSSGAAGTVITVTGSSFAFSTAGVVWFDTNGDSAIDAGEPQVSVTTTATGTFPAGITLTVPGVASGSYPVRADIPSGGTIEVSTLFTVPAPSITLSPNSGAAGTMITVGGSGFNPSTAGTVWFDTNGNNTVDAGEPQVSVTTTATGIFPVGITLTIPSVASGPYPVRADIPSGGAIETTATFTVPAASITLSPTAGIDGTIITITGSNFALNTAGVGWFDTNGNSARDAGEPQVSVTTTATGTFPAGITLTVPSVASGTYQVWADIPSGGAVEATATFTVPTLGIVLSPATGAPGTVTTITGSGFTPGTAGVVWFDTNGNSTIDAGEPQVSVTTTASGAFPAGITLAVPSVASGTYQVRADIPSGGAIEAATTFTVPASSITLTPNSGVAGTVITITGSSFAFSTAGVVWFDTNGDSAWDAGEPQVSVTTTATGTFPAGITLTVPGVASGSYPVRADIPSGGAIEATATFTVPVTSITLTPNSGVAGTVTTITANAFNPSTAGVVWFDTNGNSTIDAGEPQVSVITTATGTFPAGITLTVPTVTSGPYQVRADTPSGGAIEASATFTVPVPSITLSPASGTTGTVITITASGFTPGTAGTVWFDTNGNSTIDAGEPQVSVTTTATGTFPAGITLNVPAVVPATYQVRADIPSGGTVEAAVGFTLSALTITLSPATGAPGTITTVTGSGFTPGTAGVVWFDTNSNNAIDAGEPQVAVTTTAAGALPAGVTLTIPSVAPTTYQVRADIPSGGTVEATATFTVPTLSITLSPATGSPGMIITVTGSGFTPGTAGTVWFDTNSNNAVDAGEPQASVTTTSAGALPAGITLAVPSVASGTYQMLADIPSGGTIEASATFTVPVPSITLTPNSGVAGTVTTITASGFTPGTAGTVWFDTNGNSTIDAGEPQASVTTTATGTFPSGVTLTVPAVGPATYQVRADIPSGGAVEAAVGFTLSTLTITLSPITGAAGTVIIITGSGFTPGTAGVVWFDTNGNSTIDAGEPQVSVTTTTVGALPAGITLAVPTVAPGTYLVRADIPSGGTVEATATFTVPSPSITLSPTSGVPGTVITITGSGFTPGTAGVVWFDTNGNSTIDAGEPQVSVTTTAVGALPAGITLAVPTVAPGTYLVRADIPSGGTVEATATFTVPSPSITLSPTSGVPGTVITITGSGFTPNTTGWAWFDSDRDSVMDPGEPQLSLTSTAVGAIPPGITLTVPTVAVGGYRVLADVSTGGAIEDSASFTVSTVSISLSPTSGAPGTVITITGGGFTSNTAGWVWFDSDGDGVRDAGEPQVPVTTTAAGAIPGGTILSVVNVAPDTYQVLADIPVGGTIEASASFTIPAVSLSLNPTSGAPGTVITVTGSGFNPGTAGTVWFDSNSNNATDAGEPQASIITTADGAVPAGVTLTIPATVAPGGYQVRADIPSGGTVEASAGFTVLAVTIALSPATGTTGTVITITGSGFALNATGVVWFDTNGNSARDAGEPQVLLTTTSTGFISTGATLAVPTVAPGAYQVRADIPSGGPVEAAASFTVTAPPSPAPLLASATGEMILAPSTFVDVLAPGTLPFMGTIGIQSTGLRYHVDVWTGTVWNTVVGAGSRNASYPVSGFGLRITNDTDTSMTVRYMLVYLR